MYITENKANEYVKEYAEKVAEKIRKRLNNDYKVYVRAIIKPNSSWLYGINILSADVATSRLFYVNNYVESNLSEDIAAENILKEYEVEHAVTFNLEDITKFEVVKDRVKFELVNKEINKYLLKERPYIDFHDLAIIFYVDISDIVKSTTKVDNDARLSIPVTNRVLEVWNVSVNDLMQECRYSKILKSSVKCMKIHDVINQMLIDEGIDDYEDIESLGRDKPDIWVVSNEFGISGASMILVDGVLKEIASKVDSNLYILPSSRHEVILIQEDTINTNIVQELKDMVEEVNNSQLQYEDLLSYSVYFYDRTTDAISKVA